MADSFEIMKVLVPLDGVDKEVDGWHVSYPLNDAKTDAAWKKASELAKEGWELVDSVTLNANSWKSFRTGDDHVAVNMIVITGYILLFKRRIEKA